MQLDEETMTVGRKIAVYDKKPHQAPIIVISNRLPFVLKRDKENPSVLHRKASAGGLVTAVAPVVIDCEGLWVGWTGLDDFDANIDRIPESDPDDKTPTAGLKSWQAVAVAIDRPLFDDFYNGCCNGTYWPLFHSMPDRAVFNRDHWKAYQKVNEIFALKTMEAIRKMHSDKPNEAPIVWIHDYQLMLAANTIRDMCIDEDIKVRMGFFLHIPFPSFDIIRIFPWVDEIIMGMLGCDLIGLHIEDYCLNFIDCCQRVLGCRTDKNKMLVEHTGRLIKVKAMPIGIPYQRFESMAKSAPRVLPLDHKVILGVDRLDYTKGLVARMKALERMFEKYPKWIGKVTFIQVAVPSRTDVDEYKELKEELDRLVGRINGRFTTPAWSPIRYIFGSVTQDQLAAFYRDSQVALVTPLRDGMNLVAKEFVACQDDDDPGVLILSPFAGAGGLMQEALQVNPYETDNVADVLNRAIDMHLDERQLRMNQLKRRERRMDVDAWVRDFLNTMDQVSGQPQRGPDSEVEAILGGHYNHFNGIDFEVTLGPYVEMCTKLGVILDFDGTLAYLARTPDTAFISPETKKVLERLANMADVHVAIISGRKLDDLKHKVGVEGMTYAGCQGLEILHPDGSRYSHDIPDDYKLRLEALEAELKAEVEVDGAWVENKTLLVAWHFREVTKNRKEELMEKARTIYAKHNFEILTVSKRFENLPPSGFDRGESCIVILRSIFGLDWEERVKVIYAGDSAADEFAITRLKGVAYTFRVTNEDSSAITKTAADYWLSGPEGVLNLLRFLERKLLGRSPRTLSRASSVSVGETSNQYREIEDSGFDPVLGGAVGTGDATAPPGVGQFRRRTNSHGSSSGKNYRARTSSTGSSGGLIKKTLNRQMHTRLSRDESTSGTQF